LGPWSLASFGFPLGRSGEVSFVPLMLPFLSLS
jgi:hypothetical protein